MKIIIITGPSGSGKTYLTTKLAKIFKESIVLSTDSYYRDIWIIKFLSIIFDEIYDHLISLKNKELNNTIASLNKKKRYITLHNYDFKTKKSSKSKIEIKNKNGIKFIILEGIFAHRLDLNYNETLNILVKDNKNICYQRRLHRDQIERGRINKEVNNKFNKSWNLYFKSLVRFINNEKVILYDSSNENSYNEIILAITKYLR